MNRQEKEKVALDGNITNNCAAINNNALFFFFWPRYLVSCLVNDVVFPSFFLPFLFFFSSFSNLIANYSRCCCYYCCYYSNSFYCGFLPFSCALRLHVMITAVYLYECVRVSVQAQC